MKRFLPFFVSLTILALLYWKIPVGELWAAIRNADLGFFALGAAFVLPVVVLASWKLVLLAPRAEHLNLWESIKIRLATGSIDVSMPSGSGVIGKAWFLTRRGHLSPSFAGSLVIFDKMTDVAVLLAWCVAGIYLAPDMRESYAGLARGITLGFIGMVLMMFSGAFAGLALRGLRRVAGSGRRPRVEAAMSAWREVQLYFWSSPGRLAMIATISITIWFLQLIQMHCLLLALGGSAPLSAVLGRNALALLAGFVPFTLGGIGTRDVALISLYRGYIDAPTGAALGILSMVRFIGPALLGLPFLREVTQRHRAFVLAVSPDADPAMVKPVLQEEQGGSSRLSPPDPPR